MKSLQVSHPCATACVQPGITRFCLPSALFVTYVPSRKRRQVKRFSHDLGSAAAAAIATAYSSCLQPLHLLQTMCQPQTLQQLQQQPHSRCNSCNCCSPCGCLQQLPAAAASAKGNASAAKAATATAEAAAAATAGCRLCPPLCFVLFCFPIVFAS